MRGVGEKLAREATRVVERCDHGLLDDDPASAGDALEHVRAAGASLGELGRALALLTGPLGNPFEQDPAVIASLAAALLGALDDDALELVVVEAAAPTLALVDAGAALRGLVVAAARGASSGSPLRLLVDSADGEALLTLSSGGELLVGMRFPLAVSGSGRPERVAARGRRALVAEDNAQLRELEMIAMESLFDEVLGAVDGVEAMEILERLDGDVDVLVLDLRMPRRNGLEVLTEAKERWPQLRVVVASGAAPDVGSQSAVLAGAQAVLTKPFRLGELRAVVRSVLDGAVW